MTVSLITPWQWATWAAMVTSLPVCTASYSTLVAAFEVENEDDAVFVGSVRAKLPSLAGSSKRVCSTFKTSLLSTAGVKT